ncbi:MAG: hypothetical protein ACRC3H_16685 [Lachnospiraceae bacterium]
MEKLQAIVSLRPAGYCQAVLKAWFSEPEGFIADRIASASGCSSYKENDRSDGAI